MAKKKGKGKGVNYSSPYGDGVDWDIDDYLPVWELPEGETFSPINPLSFNTDLQGRSQLFLPLYVNNDGIGNDTDGFNTITLSLDPTDTVGFTQETYILKESWDAIAGDVSTELYRFFYPRPEQLADYLSKTFLVDGASRPFNTPRLIPGGRFKEIIIIIEDAQSPLPIQLGAENNTVPGSGISNTNGINVIYAGAGSDTIDTGDSDDTVRGEEGDDLLLGGNGDDMLYGEAGNDLLRGSNSRITNFQDSSYTRPAGDYLNGGTGNDTIYGEGGWDTIDGMEGDDLIYGDNPDPGLDNPDSENPFTDEQDVLSGGNGNDVIFGGADNDKLFGDAGDDYLSGGPGQDSLEGGDGRDRFDFYTYRPGFEDDDFIVDFNSAEDTIGIYVGTAEPSSFRNVGLPINGAILSSQFVVGTAALDAGDRFIFNSASDILFFDPDGTGPAAQARLVSFDNDPVLTAANIVTFDDTRRRPALSAPLPPPPSVQFAQSTLLVSETAGVATLTLNRTGTLAGLSQVSVAIAGGTATAGVDYDAASFPRTITFGISESSKTIEIPILTDALVEGSETISLSVAPVNNPLARTLDTLTGNVNSTTITIQDAGATNGNDLLIGTPQRDAIAGLNGNDTILGLGANDTLTGGRGNDTLFGGTGNDTLRGNQGRDVFALERGTGSIRILDFQDGGDRLGLVPGLRFPRLKIVQQGSGSSLSTRISLGSDLLAILPGIAKSQITKADFVSIRSPAI
ncbi:Calx-beta domain-containing protein [Leptolyngbya sp. O-77]|uniref:Calx-beta domain-containing protein n=1 Tax=Leptolyngbya sp. O-77 TaxID=1080068 RepID=UPI00074D2FDF|nr:Calx-beta domain-containing protein [Leptolyngbya sp. O-77]BAU40335.1 Bifunctional hemolysin/adenylate cyclase precursor [Leptolyngbya sp. O-77]